MITWRNRIREVISFPLKMIYNSLTVYSPHYGLRTIQIFFKYQLLANLKRVLDLNTGT